VFLVIVLKELTELTKGFDALRTAVGIVGDVAASIAAVGEHGSVRDEWSHVTLLGSEIVNGSAGLVLTPASSAKPTFHVLHGICPATEPRLVTHRARHIPGTMHLHVHIQLVLSVESATTSPTAETRARGSSVMPPSHTLLATGVRTFPPLIGAKIARITIAVAIGAVTSHGLSLFLDVVTLD
jgi:hypothetical protein